MESRDYQKQIVRAGLMLLGKKLAARTWGNVSLRTGADRFVITPSGIPYEHLEPEQVPEVNIKTLSWSSGLKPSSETGIHAGIYLNRPDIHAIIHTHQSAASSLSATRYKRFDFNSNDAKILGGTVAVAPYALPGTGKLKKAAVNGLLKNNALLLANHGAICIGRDLSEAFKMASVLESACERFLLSHFSKIYRIEQPSIENLHETYLKLNTPEMS